MSTPLIFRSASRSSPLKLAAVAIASALLVAGCAAAPDEETDTATSDFCARMVTNSGGLEDRSFNQSSWEGLETAAEEYNIDAQVLVSSSETDLGPNVEQAAAAGCGFVLTVGYELATATEEQAAANPDVDFAIVDEVVEGDNINTAQAAYLAGYLSAGVSKTGVVATFGGGNQPPVTLFMDGFIDGVAQYNEVHGTSVVALGWDKEKQDGSFTGDFEDLNKGKVLAQGLIDQGADVILPVAGQVGEGAAAAALDAGAVSIIWVDNDGYDTLPAEYRPLLLTSVLKNTADAVVEITKSSIDGDFDSSAFVGTLENGGVDIAPFHDLEASVSSELAAEVEALRADIISGTITVTSQSTPK
jgi:basic membrane protein A